MDIPGGDVATAASAGIRKVKRFGYVCMGGGGQACVDVGILIAQSCSGRERVSGRGHGGNSQARSKVGVVSLAKFLSMDASPRSFLGALARLVAAVVDVVVAFMLVVSVKSHTHCTMGMLSHKGV